MVGTVEGKRLPQLRAPVPHELRTLSVPLGWYLYTQPCLEKWIFTPARVKLGPEYALMSDTECF